MFETISTGITSIISFGSYLINTWGGFGIAAIVIILIPVLALLIKIIDFALCSLVKMAVYIVVGGFGLYFVYILVMSSISVLK